jgi:hypothetical protein
MLHFVWCIALVCMAQAFGQSSVQGLEFVGSIEPIPSHIAQEMNGRSWRPGCPVALEDLRYLTLSYWNFEGEHMMGHMVVHAQIAEEIVMICKKLFDERFPIERMELIDSYDADDDKSMSANNTSAFCCRAITGTTDTFSKHSYGLAIDVNPRTNPYVKGDLVLPDNGREFVDRNQSYRGMVTDLPTNVCYQAFMRYGYEWGGSWKTRQDYQHFEKDPSVLERG